MAAESDPYGVDTFFPTAIAFLNPIVLYVMSLG